MTDYKIDHFLVVEEDGFEPSKSSTTDLQSAPFGHSGTPPYEIGAGGRTRTPDLLITNQLLYQLSYTSISGFCPAASGILPKELSLVKQISKKLFQGGCFFAPKTTGPGYEEERATTYSPNRRLRPPLEDRQQERARCLCALCGGEQYHWDRVWQWRGRWICRLCWARLEKEEEIT